MDLKTFIANIIDSAIWPVFLIALLIIFRKPLRKLLGRIASLTFKDVAVEFSEELAQLNDLNPGLESKKPEKKSSPLKQVSLDEIVRESPKAAILMGWNQLADSISSNLRRFNLRSETMLFDSVSGMGKLIRNTELESVTSLVFHKLYNLKNMASSENAKISETDAKDYLNNVSYLIDKISRAKLKLND